MTSLNAAPKARIIDAAIFKLKQARDDLRRAGADRAAAYVARALKSTEGARRHAITHAEDQPFRVRVHYQTAGGEPGAAVVDVIAADEEGATERACKYVRRRRAGCTIIGGDLEPIRDAS